MEKIVEIALTDLISKYGAIVVFMVLAIYAIKHISDMSKASKIDKLFWSGSRIMVDKIITHIQMIFALWGMGISFVVLLKQMNYAAINIFTFVLIGSWIYLLIKYAINMTIKILKLNCKKILDYPAKWDIVILFFNPIVVNGIFSNAVYQMLSETKPYISRFEKWSDVMVACVVIAICTYMLMICIIDIFNKKKKERYYIEEDGVRLFIEEGSVDGKIRLKTGVGCSTIILDKNDLLGVEIKSEQCDACLRGEVTECDR